MLTSSIKNDILLDDEKEADFLLSKSWTQSKDKKLNRFFLIPEMRPFLLEDFMYKAIWLNVKCKNCNKDFKVVERRYKEGRGKYCSMKCRRKDMRGYKMNRSAPFSGSYKNCLACNKSFYVFKSSLERTKYCSLKCRLKHIKLHHSPTWKGGRCNTSGYIYIKSPNHPYKNKNGYIAEHRLIMEKIIKRYLLPNELIHHKNGIRNDNRPENLDIVQIKNHYGNIECPFCKKTFLIK